MTVRAGKWKLHRVPHGPARERVWKPDEKWTDLRAPDGQRILAPPGQAHPSEFPGLPTGPPPAKDLLFDLEKDPGEQKDVAAEHPQVVADLHKLAQEARGRWARRKNP